LPPRRIKARWLHSIAKAATASKFKCIPAASAHIKIREGLRITSDKESTSK
jgi:hypothetical protein